MSDSTPRKLPGKPHKDRSVMIHPELLKQITHEAVDEDTTIRDRLHHVLCNALNRLDLIPQRSRTMSAR